MLTRPHRQPILPLLFTLALSISLVAGCGSDDDDDGGGGPAASSDYVGLLASDNGQTGPLNLTFASPVLSPQMPGTGPSLSGAAVNVTGTLSLGGSGVVNITGTLDDNDVLTMTGGGYDLVGALDDGVIIGEFSSPGIVLVTGTFLATSSTEGSPAHAFCGYFNGTSIGDPPSEDSGTFNLVVGSGTATGVAYDDEGQPIPLTGTSTSSSVSISVVDQDSGGTITATGTYDANSITGTYSVTLNGVTVSSGTFSGGICGQDS